MVYGRKLKKIRKIAPISRANMMKKIAHCSEARFVSALLNSHAKPCTE